MQSKAWRRAGLIAAILIVGVGFLQLDRSLATPQTPRERLLAELDPLATQPPERTVGEAIAAFSTPMELRNVVARVPGAPTQAHPAWPLAKQRRTLAAPSASADPLSQQAFGPAAMPAPTKSFDGLKNSENPGSVLPPDVNGDVGPNHYFQTTNISFSIYDKSGQRLLGPLPNNAFWNGISHPCADTNDGDPLVLYDHLADRWMFSQIAWPNFSTDQGPFYQCFAISKTADPLGGYWLYGFKLSDTELNDYPKIGIWPDGYYLSTYQLTFNSNQNQYESSGPAVFVFERSQMMKGASAQWVSFNYNNTVPWGGMLPSDLDGPPPPAGTPNYFVEVDDGEFVPPDDALYLWEFHVDWNDINNSTFGDNSGLPNAVMPTAPFNLLPCAPAFDPRCIPQKGTTQKVDALGDRLMHRLQYRYFGDHQSLVANHTVDVGSERAGIRWYELRDLGGSPAIHQQGTYSPGTDYRWMGSAAMDRQGNLAIGYSASSSTIFPAIRYAGRLISDAPGTLGQGEATLIAGGGAQTSTLARWGDYTMLAVDPADDCTFWYTNEYYATTSLQSWQTRIGAFRFPSCTGAATGHITGLVTNASTSAPIAGATVSAGTKTATTNGSGVFQLYNLPVGNYTLTASAPGYSTKTVANVAVTDRNTTAKSISLTSLPGPDNRRGYLPLVRRPLTPTPLPPTVTPPPSCDVYEPNDDRNVNPTGPLASGQTYIAKLCQGDEDNYFFTTTTAEQIQLNFHLPPALVGQTFLYIYDRNDLRQNADICKTTTGQLSGSDPTVLCSIPHAGSYVIRLYANTFDNTNSYTLRVIYR